MAWPTCPVCRRRHRRNWSLVLVDRAAGFYGRNVEVNRAYRCPCGALWLTVEALTSVNPPTPRLRRKYDSGQPADQTPLPPDPAAPSVESLPIVERLGEKRNE